MSDGNSCYKATWVLFTLATTGAVMPPMDDMEDMDADVNPYFTARAAKGAPRGDHSPESVSDYEPGASYASVGSSATAGSSSIKG
ncbi:hypothetical protein B0H13DRAFT_2340196 [Mycena leptocephala]|nr:hypothetical protein B0H13DRAFT_2340196 [Mycena leptocephala]